MTLIKGTDIIVVGQQPWDVSIGSNCKNIALEFSKNNRVLYINSPLDRISSLRDRNDLKIKKRINVINGKEQGLIKIQENLWNLYPDCLVESVNFIPVDFLFDWINKANAKKFTASIRKALVELKFENYLLFNDNEIIKCFYLNKLLKPVKSIYYSRDYILATDYWKKHGHRLEPLVIASNDLCVANSTYLADYCKKYNPESYYVGQGCELDIFQKESFKQPLELENLQRPIIGYVGALLSNRLDINILLQIAQQKPEWNLVLTGPEDDNFKKSHLHQLGNVLFTGTKHADELPGYINAFDVCINPQIVNELTVGNYPRKIDEYLAMGKPVVATKTKAMEIFEEYVYMANNTEECIRLIEKALTENSEFLQSERRVFASKHTWENSVAEIYKAISSS
ncbi:MAG: glycosyltransferase [Bacteroidota bacterium]|nr:glycosyltransferase [Bacteroidota bacterium]